MRRIRALFSRLAGLFRRQARERDLAAELESHLRMHVEDNLRAGMSADEARRQALIRLGGLEQTKEACRERRGVRVLDELIQDLRYGVRMLARNRGFTAVAVLSLALGIGANTAVFSLLDAVMLRDLPVRDPGRLVLFGSARSAGSTNDFADTQLYSYPFYLEMRRQNQVFSELAATLSIEFHKMHGAVAGSASLEPIDVQLVSGSYFSLLGVRPVLGRAFTETDDAPAGAHPIAMASYSWWERRFARDPAIVGKTIAIGSTVYTVVGVAPRGFFGTVVGEAPNLWIPLSMDKQVAPGWNGLDNRSFQSLYLLARLKPGVSVAQAQANVNTLARQFWREDAGGRLTRQQQEALDHSAVELTPAARGLSELRLEFSLPLQILMAVVALVLLIACANIANLLLARAANRRREISVRMAMGAGRGRLIRQVLTESLLLACCGGAAGVLFASWAGRALLAMVSGGQDPLPVSLAPDARVLAFTVAISLATALLFGAAPALRATSFDLTAALKGGRGVVSEAGRSRLAKGLIVSQVALSLVLLIAAGLFLRTLVRLSDVDTGFKKDHVLLFAIDPTAVGYPEGARLENLYQQLEQRVEAEPGVRAASVSFFTFNQGEWNGSVSVEGRPADPGHDPSVTYNVAGPAYFATMGIPVLAGRVFSPQDTDKSPRVAVINETMARLFFAGGSPIGRRFGLGGDAKHSADFEVIGVVKDAKHVSLRETSAPEAYFPHSQGAHYFWDFEVRYAGDPKAIVAEVLRAAGEVDRSLPVSYQNTLAEQVDHSVADQTLIARLSAFFGLLAVFLACVGIYGLMSYAVTRRTSEIGIRLALGAGQVKVLWMVMSESLALVALGVAVGAPAALAAQRLVAKMLFGVGPADPVALAGAGGLLLAFAALAGYLPACKAARVDPMSALRHE